METSGRGVALRFERIEDAADPRVEAFLNVRDRDLVGRQGSFMAEGEVVIRSLVRSTTCEPIAFLAAANRAEKLAALAEGYDTTAPAYVAPSDVMDRIVGFPIHRGLLALGRRRCEPTVESLLARPSANLFLGLEGIANHDNMGGIFRNAAAFGVDGVVLDSGCCDPLYRKALRVSVGAAVRLPFVRLSPGENLVTTFERFGCSVLALSPSGPRLLQDVVRPPRVAVLLGAEGPGLSQGLLERVQAVRIPMAGDFDSLNVATTSGIVLHHLTRESEREGEGENHRP